MDIWQAALYGNINRIGELLAEGVDINSTDPKWGSTPLMFAAERTKDTSSQKGTGNWLPNIIKRFLFQKIFG